MSEQIQRKEAKEMELMRLTLTNFKGIKSFTLEPQGQDCDVYGANASGKTTLQDAFLWLLFDKNSQNKKDFNIKTLDSNGQPLHGLEHTVEAVLQVDGKLITLKKTLTEKWTKKRGEAEKQFTGHQTEYWVNDVPVNAGEYQQFINGLIGEELFRLITNPMFFPSLHWEKQRALLLAICGDVSDETVIASDKDLAKLTDILNDHSVNGYKKIVDERIKKLNDEIAKIPIRIDELTRTLGEEADYSQTEAELSAKKSELQEIEKQLLSASTINEAWRKQQTELNALYSDLGKKRSQLETEANAEENNLRLDLSRLETKITALKGEITSLKQQIELGQEQHKKNATLLQGLRDEYTAMRAVTFVAPSVDDLTCPTCGQALPDDQSEAKIEEQRQKFEADKKRKMEANVAQGKKLKEQDEALAESLEAHESDLSAKYDMMQCLDEQAEAIRQQLEQPTEAIDIESHPEYQAIQQQITILEAEMDKPVEDTTSELLTKKQSLVTEIERLNSILNDRDVRAKTQERIKELEAEERKLAQQISEFEGHKFLLEKFTKAKVALLEDSINSRFQTVTFKLFDVQINGGVVECCQAMVNGVPYADANRAAQINAGLDIINTITRHYGITAPVFVDNAEAVNELIPCDSQVIRLLVSNDKTLRVETNKAKEGVLFE
jgi:exonuclease SbcC